MLGGDGGRLHHRRHLWGLGCRVCPPSSPRKIPRWRPPSPMLPNPALPPVAPSPFPPPPHLLSFDCISGPAPLLATSHLKSSDVPNHLSSFNSDFALSLCLQTRQKVGQECFPSSLCHNFLHTKQTPEDRGVKNACWTACPRNCFVCAS